MVFIALIILWLIIAVCIVLLFLRTQKGMRMFRVLWRSSKVRIAVAIPPLCILAIALAFVYQRSGEEAPALETDTLFTDYSRGIIIGMRDQGAIIIDTACSLDEAQPELAYMMPALVAVYREVVHKPTTARLVRLDDTLTLSFDGYKQFRNRTINILKGVKKKLGPRYTMNMQSIGESHQLTVTYKGTPWNNEQLCALPAMEASIREKVDPALLMSLIRHISDFDFNYESANRRRGLLALDSGEGLAQIYIGAKRLHAVLDSVQNNDDAVAAFYPEQDRQTMHGEWRKSPLKSGWVREVLADVPYYRNNGLK